MISASTDSPEGSTAPWRVVYVCKVVDEAHRSLATQVRWIRALARDPRIEHVHVLTGRRGQVQLGDNVTVHLFSRPRRRGWIREFYRVLRSIGPRSVDFYLVSQGGPYPALLLPVKLATGRAIYHWKAHPHISPRMRFYARFCDDLVFSASASSLPLRHGKVRVVGHGIDTDLFQPRRTRPTRHVVAVGRVAPVKRLDQVIRAVAAARQRFGEDYTLDIVGPCASSNRGLLDQLERLVDELRLDGAVRILGSVEQGELPDLLARYRCCISFSGTAFDKTSGEAMACGLPVITSNPATAEILPAHLHEALVVPSDDITAQATAIHDVLAWDRVTRADVGAVLRQTVVAQHGLGSFFGKMLDEIERDRPSVASSATADTRGLSRRR